MGGRRDPVIWIDSMLLGERPELLATAIAEGALLESAKQSTAQTIIAAALSTVLWVGFHCRRSDAHRRPAPGGRSRAIAICSRCSMRNRSIPAHPHATEIGLRLAAGKWRRPPGSTNGSGFLRRLHSRVRPDPCADDPPNSGSAPAALTELLRRSGIDQGTTASARIDDDLLAQIDLDFARLLPNAASGGYRECARFDDSRSRFLIGLSHRTSCGIPKPWSVPLRGRMKLALRVAPPRVRLLWTMHPPCDRIPTTASHAFPCATSRCPAASARSNIATTGSTSSARRCRLPAPGCRAWPCPGWC